MALDERVEAEIAGIVAWDEWGGTDALTEAFRDLLESIITGGQPMAQITPAGPGLLSSWLVYGIFANALVADDGWCLWVDDAAGKELFFAEGDAGTRPGTQAVEEFQGFLRTMGDRLKDAG